MSTKRVAPWAARMLALGAIGGAAFGQISSPAEITGDWKGQLDVNATKLRLVLHIHKSEAGLTGALDSLDQGALGLPMDSIRRDGTHLHFKMTRPDAQFDGEWNPSSLQFEGKWVQGPAEIPLAWKRAEERTAQKEMPMSDDDRRYLLAYLKKTEDGVLQSIGHLTPSQWTFKADPSRWSIAECVEHLVLEEQTLFRGVTQTVVNIPLPDGQARANHEQDQRIIQFLTDRSQKVSAGESVRPSGKLATVADGIAQFSKVRGETIEWVRTTPLDLRAHGTVNPDLRYLDAYGYWILLGAHSARHTAQMEEVKEAAGYPK